MYIYIYIYYIYMYMQVVYDTSDSYYSRPPSTSALRRSHAIELLSQIWTLNMYMYIISMYMYIHVYIHVCIMHRATGNG